MAQPPARCSKLPRIPGSLMELGIVSLSRYQSIVRRPKKLEAVANLPGLDAVASDGRCSLVVCARCTFGHLRRRNYSHMTNGSFVKDDESRQCNGWPRGDDRSSGESFSLL